MLYYLFRVVSSVGAVAPRRTVRRRLSPPPLPIRQWTWTPRPIPTTTRLLHWPVLGGMRSWSNFCWLGALISSIGTKRWKNLLFDTNLRQLQKPYVRRKVCCTETGKKKKFRHDRRTADHLVPCEVNPWSWHRNVSIPSHLQGVLYILPARLDPRRITDTNHYIFMLTVC